jgi:hypothetical protein
VSRSPRRLAQIKHADLVGAEHNVKAAIHCGWLHGDASVSEGFAELDRTVAKAQPAVHLPKEAAWLAEYLHELTAFPRGRHDDQVDSTAHVLDWFKQAGQEPQDSMWQMYKKQKQAQEAGISQTPRLPPLSMLFPLLRRW